MGSNSYRSFLLLALGLTLAIPSARAYAAPTIIVDCIQADGSFNFPDHAANLCKATTSKCSDLYNGTSDTKSIAAQVKNMLSWKIWGFYNGWDIDFTQSSQSDPFKGAKAFNYPMCSVVGHKLVDTPAGSTEITAQKIGKLGACGSPPHVDAIPSGNKFNLRLDQGGNQWSAYMFGAYPWFIRKAAKNILTKIKPDLTNINDVVGDLGAMGTEFQTTLNGINAVYTKISDTDKTDCSGTINCSNASITNAAQRICSVQKARALLNQGTVPNLLVYRIMKDAQAEFDKRMGANLLFDRDGAPLPTNLPAWLRPSTGRLGHFERSMCAHVIPNIGVRSTAKSKLACTASCLFGGEWKWENDTVVPGYSSARKACGANVFSDLTTENKYCIKNLRGHDTSSHYEDNEESSLCNVPSKLTQNIGFAGIIEKIIRVDVCNQDRIQSASISCYDTDEIPSKPAEAK